MPVSVPVSIWYDRKYCRDPVCTTPRPSESLKPICSQCRVIYSLGKYVAMCPYHEARAKGSSEDAKSICRLRKQHVHITSISPYSTGPIPGSYQGEPSGCAEAKAIEERYRVIRKLYTVYQACTACPMHAWYAMSSIIGISIAILDIYIYAARAAPAPVTHL